MSDNSLLYLDIGTPHVKKTDNDNGEL